MLNLDAIKAGDVIAGMGQVGVVGDIFISPTTGDAIVSIYWAKNLVGQNQRPDLLPWSKVGPLVERSIRQALVDQIQQFSNIAIDFADGLSLQATPANKSPHARTLIQPERP